MYPQLKDTIKASISPRAKITVLDSPERAIMVLYDGRVYETEGLRERSKMKGLRKGKKTGAKKAEG